MKNSILLALFIIAASSMVLQSQEAGRAFLSPGNPITAVDPATGQIRWQGTKFGVHFKGGTPKDFVQEINKQSGLQVNVIIPSENAASQLPPMDLQNVTVPQLFEAVTMASSKATNVITGYNMTGVGRSTQNRNPIYTSFKMSQGFRTNDQPPTENSIWYFFVERPVDLPEPAEKVPTQVQVYQLASLLENFSIDDITTAVKTTWEMVESTVIPEMKYHQDTGLLIAKGTIEQLTMIEFVMRQLHEAPRAENSATGMPPMEPGGRAIRNQPNPNLPIPSATPRN